MTPDAHCPEPKRAVRAALLWLLLTALPAVGCSVKDGLALNFHELRHGAATQMIAKGTPLKLIQETLGHSTIVITADTYGHVAPEVQRLAAVAMDEVLRATTGGARAPPQVTPSAPPPSA